jgi:hypothetical protein
VTSDLFVIKNLLLYLGDSARTWLEHLPRDKIHDWTDLRWVFIGNFQGTYTHPGKQWELRNCKQQPRESLRKYIRRFSKRCTELLDATDNDAISAFQNGTNCTSLIHRLGRRMPRMTRELLDIASNHADGKEAVAAALNTPQGKGKQVMDHDEGTSSRFKKKKKNDKCRRDDNLVADLTEVFAKLRQHEVKLNPEKCVFGVPRGMLLGFIVSERGIEANPEKISTIMDMGPIKNLKGVEHVTGFLAALSRFIARLGEGNLPLYKLMKKSDHFTWTPEAQEVLDSLKNMLKSPPILTASTPEEPMLLYISATTQVVSVALVVEREEPRRSQKV